MPEVENVPLRAPAPTDERKTVAMEQQAAELKKAAEAHQEAVLALQQMAGVAPEPYRRHVYYWSALMQVVASGQAADVQAALKQAEELTDGFELQFPTYVSPATP